MPEHPRPEDDAANEAIADHDSSGAGEPQAPADESVAAELATGGDEQLDAVPVEPWVDVVEPFLERLAHHLAKEGPRNHSVSLPIGSHRLLVTPLEQQLVLDHAAPGEGGELPPYHRLVLHCIGMQVGLLAQLRSFAKADGSQRGPLRKTLTEAVKAANYLAYEMHHQGSELSNSGDFDSARQCGDFRKNLLDAAERAQELLGGDPNAFNLPVGAIATSRRRSRQTVKDSTELSEKDRARALARQRRAEELARRRRRILTVTAIACCVVLIGLLVWLWNQRPVTLEHFSDNDFSQVPGFVGVAHREPAIIVIVDDAIWKNLSNAQQQAAVSRVLDVVKTAGYEQIEFRSPGRAGLAWWRKGKGVEIPSS